MEKTSYVPSMKHLCVLEATSLGPEAVCIGSPTAEKIITGFLKTMTLCFDLYSPATTQGSGTGCSQPIAE